MTSTAAQEEMKYVGIEGMPKLVDEITPDGVLELLEDLRPWDLDLAIMMVESDDYQQRNRLSLMLDDLFRMYRGCIGALLTGKPVPVCEYRQLNSDDLAKVIAHLSRTDSPTFAVLEELAMCVARLVTEERQNAFESGQAAGRAEWSGKQEDALNAAVAAVAEMQAPPA